MFRDHKSYRTLTEGEQDKRTKGRNYRSKPVINVSNKRYKCDICDKKWMSEIETEFHRELEHGHWLMEAAKDKKNDVCGICFRMQPTEDHLLRHIKTVHFHSTPEAKKVEREIFFCNICTRMFFNKVMLSWHIFYTHCKHRDRRVKLDCVLCLRRTGGKSLWSHSLLHNFSSFTTCPFCFDNFKDQHELQEHITKHNYLLRCDTCLFDAKSRELYEKHLEEHSRRKSNNVKNYDRYFMMTGETKYIVEAWLKGVPIPKGISICILCREICLDEESRKNHILVDHGNIELRKKTYMCACGEDFFNGLLLRHHVWKMKGLHRALEEDEIKNMDSNSALFDDHELVIAEEAEAEEVVVEAKEDVVEEEELEEGEEGLEEEEGAAKGAEEEEGAAEEEDEVIETVIITVE